MYLYTDRQLYLYILSGPIFSLYAYLCSFGILMYI